MRTVASVGAATALACFMAGCGSHDDWFPMKTGRHWVYQVRSGFDRSVEPIRVVRSLPVASTDGYELAGPLGASRLAWKKGTLYADFTVDAQFIPSIPLMVAGVETSKAVPRRVATWHGRVVVLGKERPGSAVLTEKNETIDLGTRKVPTILATLSLTTPNGQIELESWYQQGVGLVQQEQRTNGARIVQLQMLERGSD